jgi:opacity protein-like surface antigen
VISASAKGASRRGPDAIAFAALVTLAFTASPASAQIQPGCTSTLGGFYNSFTRVIGGVVGATTSITSVVGTMNTAFQAQGDAFAVGLPNAQTDQIAGGTWGRLIGGRVDDQATGMFSGSISPGTPGISKGAIGGLGATGTVNCHSDVRQDYAGFQLGQDLARLNLSGSGAALHVGVTGGYAESKDQDQVGSGFSGGFQVPFAGLYATYTSGNFFIDGLLRGDFYQMNLNAASAALGNQKVDAFGLSETISSGYKIDVGNNWFVTPSISGIHSTTRVDTLNLPGGYGNSFNPLYLPPGSVQFSNIESLLGRFGVQVGTSFTSGNVFWQPFVAANVWHEFAGSVKANYTAPQLYDGPATLLATHPCNLANVFFLGLYPNGCGNAVAGSLSASRVGTYGQYSAGVFAEITGTPWLGYFRIDYRDGANIQALGLNMGLRYQFDTTQHIANGALFDGPARAAPYDWTGPYLGAFTGAMQGKEAWNFPQTTTSANPQIAGLLLGGTVGYNKQYDRWVVGGEGEIAYTNASGGQGCIDGIFDSNVSQNCNGNVGFIVTAAARVGYTWLDRILLFGKFGGAWTNGKLDASCNGDANFFQGACFPSNNSLGAVQVMTLNDSRFGGVVGTGFELALSPSWSAKLEYDFMDFGSKSFVFSDTTRVSIKEYYNELKFGLNYHFNGYDSDAGLQSAPTMVLKMPVKTPPPTTNNWTGAYAGTEASYRIADAKWNTTAVPGTQLANLLAGTLASVPDPTTTPADFYSAALQGGAFAGYDWQVARQWVTGIEANVAFGDSSMSRGGIPGTYGNGSGAAALIAPGVEAEQADSAAVKFGWDASARARLGYLSTPNVLVYGTGGIAFQRISATASCNGTVSSFCGSAARNFIPGFTEPPMTESFSAVRTGWTLGGGVEAVLSGNWFGKAEFRYANFGQVSHNFFAGTLNEIDMNLHPQTYTVLGGIGYKFNANGSLPSY